MSAGGGRGGGAGPSRGPRGALAALTPPAVPAGSLRWAQAGWSGLRPRYEHATFLPARRPLRLWVFGGAHRAGNRSCVQALDPGECPAAAPAGRVGARGRGLVAAGSPRSPPAQAQGCSAFPPACRVAFLTKHLD